MRPALSAPYVTYPSALSLGTGHAYECIVSPQLMCGRPIPKTLVTLEIGSPKRIPRVVSGTKFGVTSPYAESLLANALLGRCSTNS